MAAVYVNNLVVNSGADFSQSFTLEGIDTNSAFELTNYTVEAQMRKWAGSSTSTTFTASIEDAAAGQILLRLTSTQTTALKPGRYVYDVVIIDQFNIRNRVIEGMVLVTEGVTR